MIRMIVMSLSKYFKNDPVEIRPKNFLQNVRQRLFSSNIAYQELFEFVFCLEFSIFNF